MSKSKKRKPLTCKICGKKFSFTAKEHPIKRLNKHRWKDHPTQAKRALKSRPRKSKITSELELADDLLLRQIEQLKNQYAPSRTYQPEHNIAVGALIEGVMIGVEIAKGVKGIADIAKKRKKKT